MYPLPVPQTTQFGQPPPPNAGPLQPHGTAGGQPHNQRAWLSTPSVSSIIHSDTKYINLIDDSTDPYQASQDNIQTDHLKNDPPTGNLIEITSELPTSPGELTFETLADVVLKHIFDLLHVNSLWYEYSCNNKPSSLASLTNALLIMSFHSLVR